MLKITPRAPSIVVSSKRRRDGFLRGVCGTMLAGSLADAHHRRSGIRHDRLDVGEVEIDQPGLRDQVADALNPLAQHVVGVGERFVERRALLDDLQDALVRNRDQRVDFGFELGYAVLGNLHALATFERERFGHDGDRQRARFARELGDDRCGARAGSAAHARRDEDQVRAVENHPEILARLFRRLASERRIRAGA